MPKGRQAFGCRRGNLNKELIMTKKVQYIIAAGLIAATAAHADTVVNLGFVAGNGPEVDTARGRDVSNSNEYTFAWSDSAVLFDGDTNRNQKIYGAYTVTGSGTLKAPTVKLIDDADDSKDRIRFDAKKTADGFQLSRTLLLWDSEDFLGTGREFNASAGSSMTIGINGYVNKTDGGDAYGARFIIRDGSQFYISSFTTTADASIDGTTVGLQWGAFNVTNWASYDNDAADLGMGVTLSDQTFDNVTGVGLIADAGKSLGEPGFRVDDFEVALVEAGTPDYIVLDGFDGQTIGSKPTSPDSVRPGTSTSSNITLVVGGSTNIAGTGEAVRLFDNGPLGHRIAYNVATNFVEQYSALAIEFSCGLYAVTNTDGAINIGVGEYDKNQTSATERYFDIKLVGDNTIDFRGQSDDNDHALLASNNTVNIYVNDYDIESLSYVGPDGSTNSVAANSADFWLNGALEHSTLLEDRNTDGGGTVFTSTNNLGRLVFTTTSSGKSGDYILDDIKIWELDAPEQVLEGFAGWVALYPGLGTSTNMTDDAEPDGLNNLLEYALGGDPTVDDAASVSPIGLVNMDGGSNWLNYVYTRRTDDEDLTYNVFSAADLVNDDITNATEFVGASDPDNGFETVTNRVSTAVEDQQFMQLEVEYNN